MAKQQNPIYKVVFHQQDKVIELYAREVSQSGLMAFIEIAQLVFDNNTEMLIDPAEEKLKAEFAGVKRTYIPMHQIIRIDEVDKKGASKVRQINSGEVSPASSITPFPFPTKPAKL